MISRYLLINVQKIIQNTKGFCFGIDSVLLSDFAKEVKKYVPNVVMTTVSTTISKEEEEQCRKICETLGVKYRIRPFE